MKRTVSLLVAAIVLTAGTAWGTLRTYGEITGHSVDEYGRVSVSYAFLYYKSSSSDANTKRDFTFTLQYGIDGGTTYSTSNLAPKQAVQPNRKEQP